MSEARSEADAETERRATSRTDSDAPRVAVIGTGVIGAMTAWRLAVRGARVLAFDAYGPGHDRGASAGESRIFRTAYKEGSGYVPLLQRAYGLWRGLEQAADRPLLTLCGGLTIGPADHPDVRAVRGSAEEYLLRHEVLDTAEARRRYPQHRLEEGEVAVLDPQSGVLRPEPAVQAALAMAERHGARLLPYRQVTGLAERGDGEGWRITAGDTAGGGDGGATGGGEMYDVDHVVICPGPWASSFPLPDGVAPLPVGARRIAALWFAARDVGGHRPERLPVAIRRHHAAGFSCFPVLDGTAVKIVPHHLGWPPIASPEELPRSVDTDFVRAASTAVADLLPGLEPHPVRVGVYAEGFTEDEHPLVGPLPGARNATVLTGFSGHGFKLAPVFGEIAADLAVYGKTDTDLSFLDPARLTA
ncbi:N-methyl-L-tryptophan oxidase [Streptomyces sp. ODS28]|uniref:N-methyl-L-tryptophan oxidase n=1 Tax=Streptomyces sp. ODS28 TaxID=3136688 RepID=UPI0031EA6919